MVIAKRKVNAPLDLVKQETERIDSRFLKPISSIDSAYIMQQFTPTERFERIKQERIYIWKRKALLILIYGNAFLQLLS